MFCVPRSPEAVLRCVAVGASEGRVASQRRCEALPQSHSVCDGNASLSATVTFPLGDEQLLDIAIRSNDAIVSNIDALNTAAVGILALPVAFGVFAIDKIRDLPGPLGVLSLLLLFLSTLAGMASHELGYLFAPSRTDHEQAIGLPTKIQDALEPRRFMEVYSATGSEALGIQIHQTVNISARNAQMRDLKRLLVRTSLTMFIVAAVLIRGRTSGLRASEGPSSHALYSRRVHCD